MKKTIVSYKKVILVEDKMVDILNDILNIEDGHYEECDRDGVIERFSAEFDTPDGKYGVDIKVCNGDTPYVDPVLFSVHSVDGQECWSEIGPLDVSECLLGEYPFEVELADKTLELTVQVERESEATSAQLYSEIEKLNSRIAEIENKEEISHQDQTFKDELVHIRIRLETFLKKRDTVMGKDLYGGWYANHSRLLAYMNKGDNEITVQWEKQDESDEDSFTTCPILTLATDEEEDGIEREEGSLYIEFEEEKWFLDDCTEKDGPWGW